MKTEIDISESEILEKYPEVLDILLLDQTTKKNIIWATSNYEDLGESYAKTNQIKSELITGINGKVIMPRVQKDQILKQSRVRNMAEVFTPSWICNAQNNLIENPMSLVDKWTGIPLIGLSRASKELREGEERKVPTPGSGLF